MDRMKGDPVKPVIMVRQKRFRFRRVGHIALRSPPRGDRGTGEAVVRHRWRGAMRLGCTGAVR